MQDSQQNNKRIAKNTLLLYVRMFFMMAISLFTSRVILNTLGVTDYGINNVVGGLVAMFSLLSGSLSSAISRFITFELGKNRLDRLKIVFSTSVNIQLIMAVVIIIVAEIVGVWFLNYKMNIPADRMYAANWVLHCSILAFAVNLISIPYNASIIAHERMSVFAYISIVEAVLKLAIVYMIYVSPLDRLITYTVLFLCVAVIIRFVYGTYCSRHFEECKYEMKLDCVLFKEMSNFAGWNLFGNTAYLLNTQGVNMLMNVFFGVTVNAARGIAVQVEGAVTQFVNNFMTALNPQITKSYAVGDFEYMVQLVCRGSKFSSFIMLIFIVPFELEADIILKIWLGVVPDYAATFLRLVLFTTLATIIGNPLLVAIMATGKVKRYQIMITSCGCLVFPLSWIAFKMGYPAHTTYIIYICIYFALNFIRLIEIRRLTKFPIRIYMKEVYFRVGIVGALSFTLPTFLYLIIEGNSTITANVMLRFVTICLSGVVWTVLCCFCIGLTKHERQFFLQKAQSIKAKFMK